MSGIFCCLSMWLRKYLCYHNIGNDCYVFIRFERLLLACFYLYCHDTAADSFCLFLQGRLLRADGLDFSWSKLAAWIYVTEQWPYRISFLLHILEKFDCKITMKDSLRNAYEKYV